MHHDSWLVYFLHQSRRYKGLKEGELPSCESLKDTIARALPFWNEVIVPEIKAGKNVLIAAHGNSLRGIVKHLEGTFHTIFTLNTHVHIGQAASLTIRLSHSQKILQLIIASQ